VQASYQRALLSADLAGAQAVIEDAVATGASVRAVYLEVLQPTLYEVGRLWSHAEISVAHDESPMNIHATSVTNRDGPVDVGTPRCQSTSALIACPPSRTRRAACPSARRPASR